MAETARNVATQDEIAFIDVPSFTPDGTFYVPGLGSIRRRAKALDAVLALRSAPGSGVAVELEVSLNQIHD